jgi:hypothetical protein
MDCDRSHLDVRRAGGSSAAHAERERSSGRCGILDSRRKGKLKADTWMYRPRWWYVGQSDWPEITREFERGMLSVKPRNS